ncbi:MAG: hypothetical protein LIP77_09370, partial [Planctomycetes bacterium]|nr:hypothetical protein [Planctomycetota bacterium]
MRIRCPNTEAFLELPGDSSDSLEFSCPACGQTHQVFVTITNPGDEPIPPSAATRSVATPPSHPTGSRPMLVKESLQSVSQPDTNPPAGVDLGLAADPVGRRQYLEATADPVPAAPAGADHRLPPTPAGDAGATARDEFLVPDEGGRDPGDEEPVTAGLRSDAAALPHLASQTDTAGTDSPTLPAAPSTPPTGRARSSHPLLWLAALALLAVIGYLGWQQYHYQASLDAAAAALDRADGVWSAGEVDATAALVTEAEQQLRHGDALPTARSWINVLAESSTLFTPLDDPADGLRARAARHRDRERVLQEFRSLLRQGDTDHLAAVLENGRSRAGTDATLFTVMQRDVVAEARHRLDREAETLSPDEAVARIERDRGRLHPVLTDAVGLEFSEHLDALVAAQQQRAEEVLRAEIVDIASQAAAGNAEALVRYRDLESRIRYRTGGALRDAIGSMADGADLPALDQLARLSAEVDQAVTARPYRPLHQRHRP